MSPDLLLFGVGSLLLVTGLLGGGFEVREVTVPQVGRAARIGATVAGALCIFLGLGLTDLAPAGEEPGAADRGGATEPLNGLPPDDPLAGPIRFVIHDSLGDGQIGEHVVVLVDGRPAGEIEVTEEYPEGEIEVTVDEAGRHDYAIAVTSIELASDGSAVQYESSGQGSIVASAGAVFDLSFTDGTEDREAILVERAAAFQ